MVELASKKFVCIVDESKLVEGLGGSKGERHETRSDRNSAPSCQLRCAHTAGKLWASCDFVPRAAMSGPELWAAEELLAVSFVRPVC